MHLLIDGTFAEVPLVGSLLSFLQDMPGIIGMTPITAPMISKNHAGFVGIVLIAESHISIHTIGLFGWIDIFSCKPFDAALALQESEKRLCLKEVRFRIFERDLPAGKGDDWDD